MSQRPRSSLALVQQNGWRSALAISSSNCEPVRERLGEIIRHAGSVSARTEVRFARLKQPLPYEPCRFTDGEIRGVAAVLSSPTIEPSKALVDLLRGHRLTKR